jgi:hypothetical protein
MKTSNSTRLHAATSQKTVIFVTRTVCATTWASEYSGCDHKKVGHQSICCSCSRSDLPELGVRDGLVGA